MLLGASFNLCQKYKIYKNKKVQTPFLPWVLSSLAGNVTFTKLRVFGCKKDCSHPLYILTKTGRNVQNG